MYHIPKLGDEDTQYDGSRTFTWLAEIFGLSVDLINFLICQVLALFLASFFRSILHPAKVTAGVRHAFGLVVGLVFGYFCFGQQAIHIAGLPAICYIVIRTQNPQIVQRIVMVVALAYLSCIHLHRQYYDYGSYSLDITGPLMIITQKVTSLAFSIHDGFTREEKDLTKSQQYHAVQKVPSPLEYFSYVLHFQGLMAGPMVFYKDYIEFIEGSHILKHAPGTNNGDKNYNSKEIVVEPSPVKTVVEKVIASCICAYIFMRFITVYPIKTIKDDNFINSSFFYQFWYMMMSTTVIRFKYYHAWLLADAICNNSGLGFNGYDAKDGSAKWDMISNIDIRKFELGLNFRDSVAAWNMGTNRWLRTVVYERVPKKYGTVFTFSLSALWHGFYPGYYVTFATGALTVMCARVARKLFHHRFQSTKISRAFYDVLTCLTTRVFMGYTTFPFVLLEFQASLRLYLKVFMCLHLVAFVTIFILPKFIRGSSNKLNNNNSNSVTNSLKTNSTLTNNDKLKLTGDNSCNNLSKIMNNHVDTNDTDFIKTTNDDDGYDKSVGNAANGLRSRDKTKFHGENDQNHQNTHHQPSVIQATQSAAATTMMKLKNECVGLANANKIEEFLDKTVTGIVELKDDLLRMNEDSVDIMFLNTEGLRKRNNFETSSSLNGGGGGGHIIGNGGNCNGPLTAASDNNTSVDKFLKKEIDALNAAVQQANVLPAVLSNGHAK